ncbi:MAG: NTP transferase domain-containing protein [Akkermansiaceae bacterium]
MNGLLLIGGKSSRMGQDKSELILRDGLTQRERGIELLESICENVYLSINSSTPPSEKSIPDAFGDAGPLGAIASAQSAQPGMPWLILACDLPLLEKEHLQALVSARSDHHDAVYYTSATDQLPEPLCTIWEPSSATAVSAAINNQQRCPRSVLNKIKGLALPPLDLWSLANTNTPADLLEVEARLSGCTSQKTINLSYFAQLRELCGKGSETHLSASASPAGVFEEIRAKYQIPLKRKGMMVAVNGDFTDWTHELKEGDELVFIPPVAGG